MEMPNRTRPKITNAEKRAMKLLTQPPEPPGAITLYEKALSSTRLSATTREQYVSRARSFARFLTARLKRDALCEDVSQETLRAFLSHHARSVLPVTSYQCHVQMSYLCKWLKRNGYTPTNAAEDIPRPDIVRSCRPLPAASVIADIEAAPNRIDPRRRAFAHAVIGLLFGCGMRPGEVKNLRLRDWDEGEKVLLIAYSKGRKTRKCYPPADVCRKLKEYLKVRPEDCRHDYFFAYDKIRRLGDEGLRNLFRELLTVCGHEGKRITPHIGRHVCTSRMFADSVDPNTIRSILGHESLSTTMFYAHSTPESQRNALERAEQQRHGGKVVDEVKRRGRKRTALR